MPFTHKGHPLERAFGARLHRRGFLLRHWLLSAGALALTTSLMVSISANSSAQTTALDRVMRQKLDQSQGILAAIVTSDWVTLERRSVALVQLTKDPAWGVLKTPEYAKQSQVFLRAAEDLVDAAKRRDGDAAPLAYVSLTLSCVQCHRYVARSRIADNHGGGPFGGPAAAAHY
jgi:hypothetical protein